MLHAQALRRLPAPHRAAAGHKAARRVLGAQAHLDGMPLGMDLVLLQGQGLARGHAQLPRHQVQARQRFGHGMLHLQPGVHLHEVEAALFVQQEFQRARALVAYGLHGRHGRRAHGLAQGHVHRGRGRFLDQLLVPALHRAVALAQVHRVAMAVGKDLDLDVPRALQRPLQDDGGVTEGVQRFALRAAQRGGEGVRGLHAPHAAPAATGRGLDHDGVADARGLGRQTLQGLVGRLRALEAGDAGHAGGGHQSLGAGLVAHGTDGLRAGADEHQAGVLAGLGEVGVLGQEAVARVHRIGPAGARRGNQGRDVQVRLRGRRGPDGHGLVGRPHVWRAGIRLGIHSHGAPAQGVGGAHHAQRDLAPVGDQDLGERRGHGHRRACTGLRG